MQIHRLQESLLSRQNVKSLADEYRTNPEFKASLDRWIEKNAGLGGRWVVPTLFGMSILQSCNLDTGAVDPNLFSGKANDVSGIILQNQEDNKKRPTGPTKPSGPPPPPPPTPQHLGGSKNDPKKSKKGNRLT